MDAITIDVSSQDQLKAFFAESLIMKDFHHPNVLGLAGVCFDTPDGYPFLILPFMVNRSLKDYLRNSRVNLTGVDTFPKVGDKCKSSRLSKVDIPVPPSPPAERFIKRFGMIIIDTWATWAVH